jgi:hypothetical protein
MNSAGLNLVQVGPEMGRTCARARCGVHFAQGALEVWNTYKEPPTVPLSRWHLHRGPSTSVSSLTWPLGHDALTADHPVARTNQEQRWLPKLTTGQASLTRNKSRTSSNWINPALDLPAHDDRNHRDQIQAFPTSGCRQAQLVESISITSMWGC